MSKSIDRESVPPYTYTQEQNKIDDTFYHHQSKYWFGHVLLLRPNYLVVFVTRPKVYRFGFTDKKIKNRYIIPNDI